MLIYEDIEDFIRYSFFNGSLYRNKRAIFECVKYDLTEDFSDEIYFKPHDLLVEYGNIDFEKLQNDKVSKELEKVCRYLLKYSNDDFGVLDLETTSLHVKGLHRCNYDSIPEVN